MRTERQRRALLMATTAVAMVEAARSYKHITRPVGHFSLFTDKDGKLRLLDDKAIAEGAVAAAGIKVIGGEDG